MTFLGMRVLSLGLVALLLGTTAEAHLLQGNAAAVQCFETDRVLCDFQCQGLFKMSCVECSEKLDEKTTYICPAVAVCVDKAQKWRCDTWCNLVYKRSCGVCEADPTKYSCLNFTGASPVRRLEKP
eukprot:RCo033395